MGGAKHRERVRPVAERGLPARVRREKCAGNPRSRQKSAARAAREKSGARAAGEGWGRAGSQVRRRRARPDARTARRCTAARTEASGPTTRIFSFALVTAV